VLCVSATMGWFFTSGSLFFLFYFFSLFSPKNYRLTLFVFDTSSLFFSLLIFVLVLFIYKKIIYFQLSHLIPIYHIYIFGLYSFHFTLFPDLFVKVLLVINFILQSKFLCIFFFWLGPHSFDLFSFIKSIFLFNLILQSKIFVAL
jgi:hypothetical protein